MAMELGINISYRLGSGCGAVGRAVASDISDPWFDSSNQQTLSSSINCIKKCVEKTKIKKNEAKKGHFKKHCLSMM